MSMTFLFGGPTYLPSGAICFRAENDGAQIDCEITAGALVERFGARSVRPDDLLGAFLANEFDIHAVASTKIPRRLAHGLPPVLQRHDF